MMVPVEVYRAHQRNIFKPSQSLLNHRANHRTFIFHPTMNHKLIWIKRTSVHVYKFLSLLYQSYQLLSEYFSGVNIVGLVDECLMKFKLSPSVTHFFIQKSCNILPNQINLVVCYHVILNVICSYSSITFFKWVFYSLS